MTESAVQAGRGEPEVLKLPLMRRAMARRMVEAAQVPCFYLRVSAEAEPMLTARKALKEKTEGKVPSVNDFIVRAVALAARRHPRVNASWAENAIEVHPRVNVGVAVAIDNGLVVPAIHDTDAKDIFEIADASREIADLAARRKLPRELLEDGTITVSNLGMFGIEDFDPVLNPPQAAILGVGGAAGGRIRLTLGCDHRVLTGAEGAPFLGEIKELLEHPDELMAGPDRPEN